MCILISADQHILEDSDISSSCSTLNSSPTPPSPYKASGRTSAHRQPISYQQDSSATTSSITDTTSTFFDDSTQDSTLTNGSIGCESALSDTACNCNICHSITPITSHSRKSPRQTTVPPAGLKLREVNYHRFSRVDQSAPVEPDMKLQRVVYNQSPSRIGERSQKRQSKSGARIIGGKNSRSVSPQKRGISTSKSVGVNMPTPISVTPPTKRRVSKDVTMVSEAIQTDMSSARDKDSNANHSTRNIDKRENPFRIKPSEARDDKIIVSVPLTPTKARPNTGKRHNTRNEMSRDMRGVMRKQQMRKQQSRKKTEQQREFHSRIHH